MTRRYCKDKYRKKLFKFLEEDRLDYVGIKTEWIKDSLEEAIHIKFNNIYY